MAYEPTNWKDGDLVTSAKLNKIEQGIASGGAQFVEVLFDDVEGTYTIQETAGAVFDYYKNGAVFLVRKEDGAIVEIETFEHAGYTPGGGYTFATFHNSFTALTSEDYPVSGGK